MLPADRKAFGEAVAAMLGAYGRNVNEHSLAGWWDALSDLKDPKLLIEGIRSVAKSSVRLPVPREIRDWYHENRPISPDAAVLAPYSFTDPRWPLPSEVQIARRMDPAAVLKQPLMGQKMLDYLAAHPETATPGKPGPLAGVTNRLLRQMAP